jgi:hypothetical protein
MPPNHQAVLARFIAACRADTRVIAAFLGGSYARGTADAHSDLDLYLVTTDEAYQEFCAQRRVFAGQLGDPLFLEDFGSSHMVFFILSDGSEGEMGFGRQSQFSHIYGGPHRILLDKTGVLAGAVFPTIEADRAGQTEALRQLVYWFWHDLSHFITAMARGHLWWAHGQLELLRLMCMNLARLQHDFTDPGVGEEGYFKVEQAISPEKLSVLEATYCPMEPEAMRQAAHIIFGYYQELAPGLARDHGIPYPAALERILYDRLANLGDVGQHR